MEKCFLMCPKKDCLLPSMPMLSWLTPKLSYLPAVAGCSPTLESC